MIAGRRGIRTAMIAATFLVPAVASGQSGILHKRAPSLPKSLPAPRLSASPTVRGSPVAQSPAMPGDTVTVTVNGITVQECICLPAPGSVTGVDGIPVPGVTGNIKPMPMPIDGDGVVHILPIGPPEFVDLTEAMPNAAQHGLARATMATTVAAETIPMGRGPASLAPASAGAGGLPQRAAGVRPGSITKPSALTRASAARAAAVPARVQNVGDLQTTTAPRWRDRIRFAWPGSDE